MIYRNNTRRFLVPALLLALVLFGNLTFTSSASAPPAAPLLPTPGAVVAWGDNSRGQSNVPAGLDDAVAIAAGLFHSLALKSDGTVVGWGDNSSGQATPPAGLTTVVALKSDGTVVGWGENGSGQATPPADLINVVAISAGGFHSLALKALSQPTNRDQCKNNGWQTFSDPSFNNQGDCVSFVNRKNHGNN